MRRHLAKSQIRPKVSTMPRQQSEAAAFLDIYKLVVEKKRLQQELQGIEQRRHLIVDRLSLLTQQIATLEATAHQLRDSSALDPHVLLSPPPIASHRSDFRRLPAAVDDPFSTSDPTFETLFLEY